MERRRRFGHQMVPSSQVKLIGHLQHSGNFVLVDHRNNMSRIWQSFEHPSDSTIPKMRISENTRTGEMVEARSWRDFSLRMNFGVIPQVYIWNGRNDICGATDANCDVCMWRSDIISFKEK